VVIFFIVAFLGGMAMLLTERKSRIFITRGSFSCSSCAQPVWCKKLAHFGKLTEKDEPTLSGLLALPSVDSGDPPQAELHSPQRGTPNRQVSSFSTD